MYILVHIVGKQVEKIMEKPPMGGEFVQSAVIKEQLMVRKYLIIIQNGILTLQ